MNVRTLASIIADAPIKMPPDEDAGQSGNVAASFTAQPDASCSSGSEFSSVSASPQQTQPQHPHSSRKQLRLNRPRRLNEYMRVMTIEQAKGR
jgi:hypothetical protein